MDIPKSTVKEPLKFFEWIFEGCNYREYKHDFFIEYDKQYQNVTFIKDEIFYWNNGSDKHDDTNFAVEFQKILNRQLKLSKQLIGKSISSILFNANTPVPLLSYLQVIINEIREAASLIMNYYPYSSEIDINPIVDDYHYIIEILNELEKYVEHKLSLFNSDTETIKDKKLQFKYTGNKSNLKKMIKYLEDDKQFIDSTDDYIAIFTQKPFTTKINWKECKNAFHYFIDELSNCKLMEFDRKKIWIITAKCFTYRKADINPEKMKNNIKIPKQSVIDIIEEATNMLCSDIFKYNP